MKLTVPTMIIYAEHDHALDAANRELAKRLPSIHQRLEIPDASRVFNDQVSREMMVSASVDWLVDHLTPLPPETGPALPAAGAEADAEASSEIGG